MAFVFNRWLALALFISTGPIIVFAHGFAATGSLFTGAFIACSTLSLFLFSRWADFRIDLCDFLFGILICCIAASFVVNGMSVDRKEIALLIFSLAGYPAARLFAGSNAIAPSFVLFTTAIVVVGVALTIGPFIDRWSSLHQGLKPLGSHPLVFGEFVAATNQFTASLAYLMIALLCVRLTTLQAALASAALIVPTAMFAASAVRFSFVSIGVALVTAAFTSGGRERKYASMMIGVLIVGVVLGNLARFEINPLFSKSANLPATPSSLVQAAPTSQSQTSGVPKTTGSPRPLESAAPASCPVTDLENSIAMRKQLYSDAFSIVPRAGLFGIGLDRFMDVSCIEKTEIHNTILQTIVEFGWIAGAALVALIMVAGLSLWPLAGRSPEARFALCGLIFIASLEMGHGRISRDAVLFLFLGYAAGLRGRWGRL